VTIVLLAELFEVESEAICFELQLITTSVETADDLAWCILVKIDFKVFVLCLGVNRRLVDPDYSLASTFDVNELYRQ
jgi:hypothetical protein